MRCLFRHFSIRTSPQNVNSCYVTKSIRAFTSRPCRTSRLELASSRTRDSTIYALSTAPGRAAIAIVRCSGPECLAIYKSLCPDTTPPKPRYAILRRLYEPNTSQWDRQILDSGALVLYFPAPQTVTGEDVLEFHVHGGPAIVKAVLSAVSKVSSIRGDSVTTIRYAEPGEFTRRAFYNDRLDLSQIEALGDTLSAETEQQRRLAVRGTSSSLHQRYESWRYFLLQARGELEALIDFSEDQHFDDSPAEQISSIASQISTLISQIESSIRNAVKGELLRNGIDIALLGAPNAGKSSLLNQIVGREAAIVSSEAGTTRDVVEINVDIGGFFCKFGDLAGLRAASASLPFPTIGKVEQEGIRRARARVLSADVIIVVLSFEADSTTPSGYSLRLEPEVEAMVQQLQDLDKPMLYALNKKDLPPTSTSESSSIPIYLPTSKTFPISCTTTQASPGSTPAITDQSGIQALLDGLTQTFQSMTIPSTIDSASPFQPHFWEESLGASERQRLLLQQCLGHLNEFLRAARSSPSSDGNENGGEEDHGEEVDVVLSAEYLRAAADCLARITGKGEGGDVEEVLGVVFQKFCVGK